MEKVKKVKKRIKRLIKENTSAEEKVDWVVLDRLDFIHLIHELYGFITIDGARVTSYEDVLPDKVRIFTTKTVREMKL